MDEALRRYLDDQAAPSPVSAESRRQAILNALANRASTPGLPNGVTTKDVVVSEVGSEVSSEVLTARIYTPFIGARPLPVLVYFHGGGWVAGSVGTHDPFCRLLSEAACVLIASVEYRRAPEHPFPAALEDAMTATRWAVEHAANWNGDPTRLGLGGDSAGANLAAVAANRICATGASPLKALLLLFPVTDHPGAGHFSWTENATGCGLDASLMRWFWDQYAPGVSPDDPDTSPLRLDKLPVLPPTFVATAEYDVLRDEGIAYTEKLKNAGLAVTHFHAPEMNHNFPVHPGTVGRFPQCQAALSTFAEWLREVLA